MMDLWEIYKASKGVPHSGDLYDALMGKALGGAGSVWEPETAPYFFRPSAGYLNSRLLGKEKDTIVGASVGFNQLVNSGDTSVTVTSGHKYYANINNSKTIGLSNGSAISINDSTKDNVVDLTLMLGSTIADYAYTLESGTAGAGIAWLKSYGFFGLPYYAYDGGSIKSVSGLSAHKCVGKNQCSGVISGGSIGANGSMGGNPSYDMAYGEVKSGQTYIVSTNDTQLVCGFYTDIPIIGSVSYDGTRLVQASKVFTAPINGYVAFRCLAGYETPQLELGSTATDYAPYHADTYPLDSTIELRGLFKMDADHNIYAEGDTYEADGTVTKKWAEIDLSTLNFNYDASGKRWQISFPLIKNFATRSAELISDKWVADTTATAGDDGKMFTVGSGLYFYSTDGVNAPTGTLIYPLATPTTSQAEPFASPQNVDKDGTEEYVTTQKFVPVGHSTEYKCEPTP